MQSLALHTDDLVRDFLAGRSPNTLRAYSQDLAAFSGWLGASDPQAAIARLLAHGPGPANQLVGRYRAHLIELRHAPATVNRRLAGLRALVKLARLHGLVAWSLEVPGVKHQRYRDTRGPGILGFRALLEYVTQLPDPRRARDLALVHLLHDLALRRGEVAALDVEHVDLEARTIEVTSKGQQQSCRLTLPDPTARAIERWLDLRGCYPGPLFINFTNARLGPQCRLTGRSIARILTQHGDAIGVRLRPHGLRHLAITEALDLTKGDVRAVQRFSRHRDLRTVTFYDDNRQDLAGHVARMVAANTVRQEESQP